MALEPNDVTYIFEDKIFLLSQTNGDLETILSFHQNYRVYQDFWPNLPKRRLVRSKDIEVNLA